MRSGAGKAATETRARTTDRRAKEGSCEVSGLCRFASSSPAEDGLAVTNVTSIRAGEGRSVVGGGGSVWDR